MKLTHIFLLLLLPHLLSAQINDCIGAQIVCSSESIDFNPDGPGFLDLSSSELGCLEDGENSSAWFYFEMAANTPTNISLEFLIIPENGVLQDYDFALYGPDVNCDNLGAPIRCSYAAFSPSTGLLSSSTDFSENSDGDGYVSPINVNAGQGYFLLVDNYNNDGVGFQLQWGGPAAPFLNCDATPPCSIGLNLEADDFCQGQTTLDYELSTESIMEDVTILWTSSTGNESWISNPNIIDPEIQIPPDFIGSVSFTVEISFVDFNCSDAQTLNVNIIEFPTLEGMDDETLFCTNTPITIGSSSLNDPDTQYSWELNGTYVSSNELIETSLPGEYVLYANLNGCITIDSLNIEKIGDPIDFITLGDSTNYCVGPDESVIHISDIEGGNAPFTFELNTGETTEDLFFNDLTGGLYQVIITDKDGCTNSSSIELETYEIFTLEELKDTIIKLGEEIEIIAESNIPENIIIFEEWTPLDILTSQFRNIVNLIPEQDVQLTYKVVDENNCTYETSILIRVIFDDKVYISNAFSPNDDGINDVFFIQSGPAVRSINYLNIYDRWGELVFQSENTLTNEPTSGWDGTFKDNALAISGVYAYKAELELINGDILEKVGTITIIK